MKFFHLSDLHLGKRVNEFPMLEDQKYILKEILQMAEEERPEAVLLAGDIYDKPVPPTEAVGLFDDFLIRLAGMGIQVFVISGNHDSAERIAFGGRLMEGSGIHLAPVYEGKTEPAVLRDEYGEIRVWMLPFLKPAGIRQFFPEEEIGSYTDAMRAAIRRMNLDPSGRNLLVTHQFVAGAERCESEEISVGGADHVDASVFEDFDYVALGHIHGPQQIGSQRIRYCGTPLKYSFSERKHHKSVTVVELREKGSLEIRTLPLHPRHDLREIRGTYEQLTLRKNYEGTATDDYLHVILTDELDVPDAMALLRTVYPNLMKLDYDNTRTRTAAEITGVEEDTHKTEAELFAEFYEKQNGQPMSEEQWEFARALMEKVKEAGEGKA